MTPGGNVSYAASEILEVPLTVFRQVLLDQEIDKLG